MRKLNPYLTLFAAAMLGLANAGCTSGAKRTYHAERGDHYFKTGQLAQAEIEYMSVLRIDAENAHAYGQLGLIYYEEGRSQRAAPFLYKASQLDTNNLQVCLTLGQIYLNIGRSTDAWNEAQMVLGKRPRDPGAPLLLAEAAAPGEVAAAREQLLFLTHNADSAPLETALGLLAARQLDFQTAAKDFKAALALDPKSADAYSALGNLFWTQGDLKSAESAFRTAADLAAPRSPERWQFGEFELQTGKTDEAEKAFQEMTVEAADYIPGWLGLAQVALAEKKFDDSGAALGKALDRDANDFNALMLKGQLDLAEGHVKMAIEELQRLAGSYPQAPRLRYELALAYFANAETDKAVTQLNAAVNLDPDFADANFLLAEIEIKNGSADSAVALLKTFVQRKPRSLQAKLLLADACRVEGDFNDALDIYRDLEKTSPRNPEIPLLMGSTFIEQKDDTDARLQFNHALQIAPDDPTAQEELVELDISENEFAAATAEADDLARKDPAFPDAHVLLAKIFLAQAQTNDSEAELSKAIALHPTGQLPYLLLAQLQYSSGDDQNALATLDAALVKNPTDAATLMLDGEIQTAANNDQAAADEYEKVIAEDPRYVPALNNLACLYAQNPGELDRALDLAQQARGLRPNDPAIEDTLGWVLFKKGQFPSAEKLLQDSAGQLAQAPEAQYHYGMAAYMQDDEANARTALQAALQAGGSFRERDNCNRCLATLAIDSKSAGDVVVANLEKVLAETPADPVALDRLAAINQMRGTPEKVIPYCEATLQANPQSVRAMILLAQLEANSDPAKAFELAKQAYQLKPNDEEVCHTLGRMAYLTGNYQWGYNVLQDVAQNQPENPQIQYDFAEAAFSVGKLDEALAAMSSATQAGLSGKEADDAKNFATLIPLFQNPDKAAAAESQVQQILAGNPDYAPALLAQAVIDSQKGDAVGAEQNYDKALARYPDLAPAQKNLAILYAQNLEDPDKAYSLAIKARETFPDDPDLAKALGMIVFEQGNYARAVTLLDSISDSKNADAELFYCLGISEYHLKNYAASRTSLERALGLNLGGQQASDARETLAELK